MEHGFFLCFFMDIDREVSAPGLWVNPNCYHSYGAEENVVATLYGSAASVPCGA